MDILRKELNEIYSGQRLDEEHLDAGVSESYRGVLSQMAVLSGGCYVVTDAARDRCMVCGGRMGILMGWSEDPEFQRDTDSSDEDFIYNCIHPEDLPDKRLLEYEFFKAMDLLSGEEKVHFKATSHIRIRDRSGSYIWVDNSTQILCPSPQGKIWLILCIYTLSSDQKGGEGVSPRIVNIDNGSVRVLSLSGRRSRLLTWREKEILRLVREGESSKMIAGRLHISVHTVSRHRQNILEKLSVGNSYEAVSAAEKMNLL